MPTPQISSSLDTSAAAPDDNADAPSGRTILIAGPAGKGPLRPQTVRSSDQAYSLYGTEGPLADDIAMALTGARLGAAQAGSNQIGEVLAIRTETGTPATITLKNGGTNVMELETESSGTKSNEWTVNVNDSEIVIYDPEEDERYTFAFDASGATSDIRTPSDLATAIINQTGGRLIADVDRGRAHFEFTLAAGDSPSGLTYDSSNVRTEIDFSGASATDMQSLSTGEDSTAIGGNDNYFADAGDDDDLHNSIIPTDQEDARFYAVTAGAPTKLSEGQTEEFIGNLADKQRVAVGTESLLNISTTSGTLTDAGQRDGSNVSEAYQQVRRSFAGRLDSNNTSALTDSSWAEYTAVVATDADPTDWIGANPTEDVNAGTNATLTTDDHVLVVGQGGDLNGLYLVKDDGTDLYLRSTRVITGSTLSSNGDVIDVLNAEGGLASPGDEGLHYFDAGAGELMDAEVVEFDFEAQTGIADNDGAGSAGTLATAYANWYEGDATNADDLSTGRLTPEGEEQFDQAHSKPLKVYLAPVTAPDQEEEFEGNYSIDWSGGTATVTFDAAEVAAEYDDALVYVSYDSCVYDLYEQNDLSDVNQADEFGLRGQELVFGQELAHDTVVRPLRVTQYRRGQDLSVERTGAGGNKIVFDGRGSQPGPGGEELGDIDTLFGLEYDYEPDFPAPATTKSLSGAKTGVNASAEVKANALDQALREHGKRDHELIMASGLHVDAMQGAKDPVTGKTVDEPVGVLDVLDLHQARQSETGASPIVYASVKPMEPSTTTGRYTNEQKVQRVEELTQPDGNNAASIIDSTSRPETFIFDAPMQISVGGRQITTSSPALWAGMRSTLPNTAALYNTNLTGAVTPVYKYDVAGAAMTSQLSDASVNAWSAQRGVAELADERTAAKKVVGPNGQLVETGFKSGVALLASKQFQQDAVDQLENLLGPVPSGGIEVLRGTVETMLSGIANRTSGVQQLIFNPQRNIQIRSEGGNSLGMTVTLTLQVSGELRTIELSVGAVNAATAANDEGSAIPTAQ